MTDGVKYLADAGECYWLLDAVSSYLISDSIDDDFVVAKLTVTEDCGVLELEDGNGNRYVEQIISYTDFPLPQQVLYACRDEGNWVLMLPSEY